MLNYEYFIEDISHYVEDNHSDYGSDKLNELTYSIIGAAMEFYNCIGKGFSEAVYADCMTLELQLREIFYEREKKFDILYKGLKIPHYYFADFVIENTVVLEIKAQSSIVEANTKQILNYLAASKCKYGLLINFGEDSLVFKRVVLTKKNGFPWQPN